MRVFFFLLLAFVLVFAPMNAPIASASNLAAPTLNVLQPGGFRTIHQDININVVFVGYEAGTGYRNIDTASFLAGMPQKYETLFRTPDEYYGLPSKMGLTFNYHYNLVFAPTPFEDAFFGYLSSIGTAAPLTRYQAAYNEQTKKTGLVTDNMLINAPSVEKWLANNSGSLLGVNTKNYTIFFVNWFDRADFRYHVYTKIGEPDPDTNFDFGAGYESRKIIAWGGTTPHDEETGLGSLHRIWFYDLSAGPEAWTDNWNVDTADLDGNGAMEYRMPPVWEYGNLNAYRPFNTLSGDLAKVARYAAIDGLFTTSPLYNPAISAPKLPMQVQLDINVYQGIPGVDGTTQLKPSIIQQEVGELQPYIPYSTQVSGVKYDNEAEKVFNCFFTDVTCYGNRMFGIAFADLFLYNQDHLMQYVEGDADYEVPVFLYVLPREQINNINLLGFADDNWRDGTQSFVFAFNWNTAPGAYPDLDYGNTSTLIHEIGHHLGMSHPFHGYDFEQDLGVVPSDDFYFVWSADENNSPMGYLWTNFDFSQFDHDNMNRYMTISYINQANAILAQVVANAKAKQVNTLLQSADGNAAQALSEYQSMNYLNAAVKAQMAYKLVLQAARQLKIPVERQAWQADYKAKGRSPLFVDPVDYRFRNRP